MIRFNDTTLRNLLLFDSLDSDMLIYKASYNQDCKKDAIFVYINIQSKFILIETFQIFELQMLCKKLN
jgi:hypothetical protein